MLKDHPLLSYSSINLINDLYLLNLDYNIWFYICFLGASAAHVYGSGTYSAGQVDIDNIWFECGGLFSTAPGFQHDDTDCNLMIFILIRTPSIERGGSRDQGTPRNI